jgi:hypothetical protein
MDGVKAELQRVRRQIQEDQWNQEATVRLAELENGSSAGNVDRWQIAHTIRTNYPTDKVKAMLRQAAQRWLSERLEAKKAGGPADIEEIETGKTSGKPYLYQGYFKPVTLRDGTQGYERHPTAEHRRNPTSGVGTVREADIVQGPGPPAAHRCVQSYNNYLTALLRRPEDKLKWEGFVTLCVRLEEELARYLEIPGHGQVNVSFRKEAEFARQLLHDKTWPMVESVLRPTAAQPKPAGRR